MLTITNHPIFKAHVFHIDPNINKTWVPDSSEAASVSFFLDNSTGLYSVFSVEKCQQIIKSVITADTIYSKTSCKFFEWGDSDTNMIYGLAFSCVGDLQSFIKSFDEAILHAAKVLGDTKQITSNETKLLTDNILETPSENTKQNITTSLGPTNGFFQKFDEAKLEVANLLRPALKSKEDKWTTSNLLEQLNKDNESKYRTTPNLLEQICKGNKNLIESKFRTPPNLLEQIGNDTKYLIESEYRTTPNLFKQIDDKKLIESKDSFHSFINDVMQHAANVLLPPDKSKPQKSKDKGKLFADNTSIARKSQDYRNNNNPIIPNILEQLNIILSKDLTADNKKLIFDLGQYAATEKIFELNFRKLLTTNTRLKSDFLESTSEAEEYKKELQLYKENNAEMVKCRFDVGDCKGKDENGPDELRKEIQLLRLRVEQLETLLFIKNIRERFLTIT